MPNQTMKPYREAFEKRFTTSLDLTHSKFEGVYANRTSQSFWEGWQAAKADQAESVTDQTAKLLDQAYEALKDAKSCIDPCEPRIANAYVNAIRAIRAIDEYRDCLNIVNPQDRARTDFDARKRDSNSVDDAKTEDLSVQTLCASEEHAQKTPNLVHENQRGYSGAKSLCETCGNKPVMHRGGKNQCCGCHVSSGAAPANWHPDCMKAHSDKSGEMLDNDALHAAGRTPEMFGGDRTLIEAYCSGFNAAIARLAMEPVIDEGEASYLMEAASGACPDCKGLPCFRSAFRALSRAGYLRTKALPPPLVVGDDLIPRPIVPVMVDLDKAGSEIRDLNMVQFEFPPSDLEYRELAKACAEAWRLKWE